jgi:predicted  nucleic acid-binding Zn-ribbon protein
MEEIKQENKPEVKSNLIEDAIKSAERLEKANAELKAQLDRQEQLMAQRIMGGRSEAGSAVQKVDPEIEAKERLKNYFKGTAIGKMIK